VTDGRFQYLFNARTCRSAIGGDDQKLPRKFIRLPPEGVQEYREVDRPGGEPISITMKYDQKVSASANANPYVSLPRRLTHN
jgi:hypothetical protein